MKNPLLCIVVAALVMSCAPTQVQRHAWVTGLRPEKADTYRKLHAAPWPEVSATIKRCHIRNFSIYEREIAGKTYLFAYLEYTGNDFAADMAKMADCPHTRRWWKETDPCQSPLPEALKAGKIWSDAKVVYHQE